MKMSGNLVGRSNRRRFARILAGTGAIPPALLAQESTPPAGARPAPPPQTRTGGAPNPKHESAASRNDGGDPTRSERRFLQRSDVAPKVKPFPMTQVRVLWRTLRASAGMESRLYAEVLGRSPDAKLLLQRRPAVFGKTARRVGAGHARDARRTTRPFHRSLSSAAALLYASTGDKEIKAKGDEMVDDLAKAQSKLSGGYLSAFPTEWFDRLDARKPVWAPFYTIHKIMAGMLDQYQLAGNKQALEVVQGMASWADNWTASKSEEHMQSILETEYGGMNEVLYNIAIAANDDRWARAGDRFTKKRVFNPLALGRDELRGLHVNTHIPQVIGAARRYEISGDERFRDVSDFFLYTVTTGRTYVTGGTSNGEGWLTQPHMLAAELKRNVATAECCCAYNMLKLARHAYSWTADPRYFDYYERILINHRIGTIQPESGYTQYYLSLTPGAWKTFNTEDQSFWCCTGTGVEEYSKLNDSIYWQDADGIYVNLFIPSEVNWTEKGFHLTQETKFPEEGVTTLRVRADKPVQAAVRLRIPEWAAGTTVKINGKTLEATGAPGSYLTLNRHWKTGDRIEMTMPMKLRVEKMPDDRQQQAFLYGPVVLAGDLGASGLDGTLIVGPNAPRMRDRPIEVPVFRASAADPSSWIKPVDAPLAFRTSGQGTDVSLVPLNSIFGKRYSVYWQVS